MMNERRFKLGLISMNVAASWGKDLAIKIKEVIPDDSIILKQNEETDTASVALVIYNKDFDIVPDGKKIPRVVLDIKFNEKIIKPSLALVQPDSKIILPK